MLGNLWRKEEDNRMVATDPLVWVSSILIVVTLSFGFRSSRPWRIVEHLLIGGAAGNLIAREFKNINRLGIQPAMTGNIAMIITIILGLVLYTQFIREYRWL
jgi:lipoprotein signal peptidase